MQLLSVDPGKHTGWATWEYGLGDPTILQADVTHSLEEFYDFLIEREWISLNTLVMEDYKVRPEKFTKGWGHQWSNEPALHIIGALELFARQNGIQIFPQPASILPVGCGYIGYNYRKGVHVPNNISAIAHGAYWLVKNKHANSRGFKTVTSR